MAPHSTRVTEIGSDSGAVSAGTRWITPGSDRHMVSTRVQLQNMPIMALPAFSFCSINQSINQLINGLFGKARHHALNDLIVRSFASAGVPVTKEPVGLFRTDGKRPDGLTLIARQSGKSLCWDVTFTCPLAESYIESTARQAGSTAEMAASRKKYMEIEACHLFQPTAMETLGVFSSSANSLAVWVTEFPPVQARLERHVFSYRESQCCCSASTLSYSTTACRR